MNFNAVAVKEGVDKPLKQLFIARKISEFSLVIFLFFVLFGPKFGSYVDTSMIMSIAGIMIMAKRKSSLNISKKFLRYIFFVLFIFTYAMMVMLFNNELDIVIGGRYLRSIISMFSIWIVLVGSKYSVSTIIKSLLIVLTLHAITVIITAGINPQLQEYISWFNGYEKKIRSYRSTGLMMGFDMAGMICNIGFLLAASSSEKVMKNITSRILMLIFITASVLTSRFSIVMLVVLMLFFIFYYRKEVYKRFEVICCSMVVPLITIPFIILLISTTNLNVNYLYKINDTFPETAILIQEVEASYANTNLDSTASVHFNFDSLTLPQLIFGAGYQPLQDPGYTRTIYSIGILGLILNLIWYTKLYLDIQNINRNRVETNKDIIKIVRQVKFVSICIFVLLLILSFKNNYFFTGTFFEIFIIMVVIIYKIKWKRF
ncbi:hypothetical protein [Planococcus sp. SSTMD024]|uniref:hypothetical protein n=1 Tax=Planococcus sp. SSTMD024 TaxID=3242163 RepID=UPI00351E3EB6